MGIAFLTKQHAIFILPILLFGLLTRENTQQSPHSNERTKNISRFIIGFIIPIILWLAIEGANGNLEQSMYWTFTYNLFGPYRQLGSLLPEKSDVFNLGLWLAPGLLLCALLCYNTKDRSLRTRLLFLLTIGVTSMSTIFPRYSNLHLAPSIPAFSIAFGVAVSWVFDRLNFGATNRTINRLATGMVSVLLIGAINPLIAIPNMKNFESIFERQEVNAPPSPECLVLYIEKNTKPSEQIYVLAFGYEGIYFDSGRLPAGKVWQALEWYSILPQFRSDILTLIDEKKPKMFLLSARNNMPYSVDLVSHQMIVAHLLRAGYTTGLDCAQTEVWER